MYKKYPYYRLLNPNYVCRIGKNLDTCSKKTCEGCRHYISTTDFFSGIRGEQEGGQRDVRK